MVIKRTVLAIFLIGIVSADKFGFHRGRTGRQNKEFVTGGVDFTGCVTDPATGFCCIEKDEEITSMQKDPVLECTHKNVEKCHYTYVTQFTPAQEEVCEENFEKICQVTFKQQAFNETVKKCYRPLEKVCNGQGPEECKTVYESSCTTKYVEKQPGKFVGDTNCEKLPIEICGAGCITEEGAEECHDKVITSLIDVPEEVCDLNPQKTCKLETKLVPKLSPKHECTTFPQEVCHIRFTSPKPVTKILKTKWCQDPSPPVPGETYEESDSTPPVITQPIVSETDNVNTILPAYGNQPPPPPPPPVQPVPARPPALYDAPVRSGRNFVDNFSAPLPSVNRNSFRPNNFRQG